MSVAAAEPGTVISGDVEIFYRSFSVPGGDAGDGPPVLVLHGAGYYDSADWVSVGSALAAVTGREVVAFDARGYGQSGWSATADYSLAAQMGDITALLDGLGWERAVLLGHSRGGSFTLRYAAESADRVAAVIFADSCPGRTARGPIAGGAAAGALAPAGPPDGSGAPAQAPVEPVYPTLEAALASTSRDPRSLEDPAQRARLEEIFVPAEGAGFRLALRDPAFQQGAGGGSFDGWAALAAITVPALFIRALASLSFDDAAWARAQETLPGADFVEIDAGHDLANEAPEALVGAVGQFLGVSPAAAAVTAAQPLRCATAAD